MLFEPRKRESLADGVVAWLTDHLADFDPPQEDAILNVAPEEIRLDKRRKAFGELGAALRLTARRPDLLRNGRIRNLTDRWVELGDDRRIFFELRRRIHLFPLRAAVHAARIALGHDDASVSESLQIVLDRGFIDRTELSAWHKLDLKYYFEAIGLRHGFADDETLFRQSSLTKLPALPHATNYDLYGLTHLVFHFSDFGERALDPLLGRSLAQVREYSGSALAMCLAMREWDLTAELLLTRVCLGVRDDPLDREAANALCDNQQPSGFVPGRSWVAGTIDEEDPAKRAELEFFDVYHPTLLCLFLICVEMARS